MPTFRVGDRFSHSDHGDGTIIFVGSEYVGIEFDGIGSVLLRMDTFETALSELIGSVRAAEERPRTWPDSTFVRELPGTEHFLGSHWKPFFDDEAEPFKQLLEIVPRAVVPTAFTDAHAAPREPPADWPRGAHLAWPERTKGLMLTLQFGTGSNELVSLFPFIAEGAEHAVTLWRVLVWEGGCEAQIAASLGDAEITFFDTLFLFNHIWYEAGRDYDFVLTGIAYEAAAAALVELPYEPHREVVAWQQLLADRHGKPTPEVPATITLEGSTMLLHVQGWDEDEYSFRGPIKSVREVGDVLGQSGWLVRATVLRRGVDPGEDIDLDILITRKAWQGNTPPQVGQDIEGRLWLQGYLSHSEMWRPAEAAK